ncbi:acyltransferase family protein [Nocardiopsis mangrovi]|uniref:Acyltransferase family protein n=1 Tax=Nocardiopsis mangrovi TaxID=1179818 RepID=A0ABV9DSN0_9ACTN
MRSVTTDTRSAPAAGSASALAAQRRFFPEVQGLRAVAVVLVLLYHVDKDLIPGGYAGVDVFFVISGFLITTLLLREARDHGRVSLARFYVRRIRRILPASTLVLLVTGAAAFALLPSPRLLDTAGQLVASAAYLENIYLAQQAVDYLAAEAAASPVQHYWSLAVEEQFYLVWPLLFLGWAALGRRGRGGGDRTILAATGVVLAASFVCSVMLTAADPQAAYFLPQTRMWELAVGGVLAIALSRWRLPARLRWALGWAGLGAILVAVSAYDDATAFPGWAAALPVLGAAAVIAAGESGTRWSSYGLLSTAPARFIGDISYALYLWHWPLVVFTLSLTESTTLSPPAGVAVIVLSVALAWATKICVEDPVRDGGLLRAGRSAAAFAMAATLIVTAIGGGQYLRVQWLRAVEFDPAVHVGPQALSETTPEGDPGEPVYPSPVAVEEDLPSVYADDCQAPNRALTPQSCEYGPAEDDAAATVVIVGDSHAAHWVPALREVAAERDWRLLTYTKSSCPFSDTLIEEKDSAYPECPEWNTAVAEELTEDVRPDAVFTSSHADADAFGAGSEQESTREIADGMARLWDTLEDAGSEVVAIRDNPGMRARPAECVARHDTARDMCTRPRDEAFSRDDPQLLAAEAADNSARVVDLTEGFCTDESCPVVVGNVLAYRDSHHLTATYSELLAPLLARKTEDVLDP